MSREMGENGISRRRMGWKLEERGKSLWMKVKFQLVDYHSLPPYLRDNEFIMAHYRPRLSIKYAFLSIFSIHNETLNVWTHFIGFLFFLWLTIYTGNLHLSKQGANEVHVDAFWLMQHSTKGELAKMIAPLVTRPITRWPFFAFLGGVMFCLLASSACHMLSCHSERLSYIMLRIDYAGIAALISTSFYPPVYYSFMCYPFFCNLYLGFITLLGIAAMLFSLIPTFQKPEFRIIRVSLFSGMGLSGILPVFHKHIIFRNQPEALLTTGYEILMGVFYLLGALIYATRVPERWIPGKFDIAGSSHQLFHILVVVGAYTHYRNGLIYLQWRDSEGC